MAKIGNIEEEFWGFLRGCQMVQHSKIGSLAASILLGLVGVWWLGGYLQMATAEKTAVSRPQDPVIITTNAFPAFNNAPIPELALLVYQNNSWQAIPFQIDEVSITGTYVLSEDGLLDSNDELVFMGADAGELISPTVWPNDFQSQLNPRYAITITDPLSPTNMAWAYLYRSTTLTHTAESYVAWDEAGQALTAVSYTLSFSPSQFLGISNMTLNGQPVDILDRQKVGAGVTVFIFGNPGPTTIFNEETILDFLTQTITITLPIAGPVRAVGGNDAQNFAFYGAKAEFTIDLPLVDIPVAPFTVAHFDYISMSMDLNDPVASGMTPTSYYNNNGVSVSVDGTPDVVGNTPPLAWSQIDGGLGGWVTIQEIDPADGTLTNYYKDDDTLDPNGTGDGRSYGDAGFRIDEPNGTIAISQTLYILPLAAGNVGAIYQSRAQNPLTAETAEQIFVPTTPVFLAYLPLMIK